MAFLTIAILVGALLSAVTGASALRAGLRLKRARAVLEAEVGTEVVRLVERASELEESISVLSARAEALPIRVSELRNSLMTLGILTGALGASLRQAQKVLTSAGMKSAVAKPLSGLSKSFRGSRQ